VRIGKRAPEEEGVVVVFYILDSPIRNPGIVMQLGVNSQRMRIGITIFVTRDINSGMILFKPCDIVAKDIMDMTLGKFYCLKAVIVLRKFLIVFTFPMSRPVPINSSFRIQSYIFTFINDPSPTSLKMEFPNSMCAVAGIC